MKPSKIITHGGITLDISSVKAFHIDSYNPHGKSHILRIEFFSKYEFLFNPEDREYEKILMNDFTEHPYADYATAEAHRNEWEEIWQDNLLEK